MMSARRIIAAVILATVTIFTSSAQEKFTHPWKGKTVAFLGDSITDPGSVPDKHDWTGKKDMHYWGVLQEMLGIRPYVYGVSGMQWNDVVRQARQLKEEHGDDFDAIMIFMGANDYMANTPLGEWYELRADNAEYAMGCEKFTAPRSFRVLNKDMGTLRGRINVALEELKKMFPTKQIIVLTPLHRGFSTFSEENIQPDERHANFLGLFIDDYVDTIKEAADVWAVPVIDIFSLSGLQPMVQEQLQYFSNEKTDQLHPNANGHNRLGKTLYYQLAALPCIF